MTFPTSLRHFGAGEFGEWADTMDHGLLFWLDDVRDRADLPFIVTSSGRTAATNATVNGYNDSQHIPDAEGLVKASDIQTEAMRDRLNHQIAADNFLVGRAALWDIRPYGRRCEVICECRAGKWHWHFALFHVGDQRPSRFTIIRKDSQ